MQKKILLEIARGAIVSKFNHKIIDREKLLKAYPELEEQGAVFVTLKERGNLRGCIGSLIAHRSLLDDIISNAKSAAFGDPRFPPLKERELEQIKIEVSLLSPYKELEYKDKEDLKQKIRVNIDGIILKSGSNQATFLPQVWEDIPDFDSFFVHLCNKAGLSLNCLDHHPAIYTYQVEKIEE